MRGECLKKKAIENIKVNSKFFFTYAKKYSKTIDGAGGSISNCSFISDAIYQKLYSLCCSS